MPCTMVQGLPAVRAEARVGRTPLEEQLWMQLHAMYVREIEVRGCCHVHPWHAASGIQCAQECSEHGAPCQRQEWMLH